MSPNFFEQTPKCFLKRTNKNFSLFRDYPEEVLIENCRKNRLIDYALQQAGIPIIPTAGFADESSWEWCFDGLPLNSTVAVTTNCLGRDREAHRLFVGGINAMVEKIHPTAIVVCGKVPAWLEKNFPTSKLFTFRATVKCGTQGGKNNGRI